MPFVKLFDDSKDFPLSLVRIFQVLNCDNYKQSCSSFPFKYSTSVVAYYFFLLYFRCLNWIINLKAICSVVDVLRFVTILSVWRGDT